MTSDTAVWRGLDRVFVETVATVLRAPIDAHLATVGITINRDRSMLAFVVHDGVGEYLILIRASGVTVHRRVDGKRVGGAVTLSPDDAEQIRTACHALLDRIKTPGGFQSA